VAAISAIIIDDEAPAREVIKNYAQDHPDIRIVAECSNGFEGLKMMAEHQPDLVFLDIQMPKLTGFELLELLDDPPVIIFSTAYDQFAIKAFEVSAADYLLKPYSRQRFAEALDRARMFMQDRGGHRQVVASLVKQQEASREPLQRIVVKTGNKIHLVPVEEVVWLEAQDDYVMIHAKDGGHLKARTMKYFETHLDRREFVRIHRSHIVRLSFIKQLEQTGKESYRALLHNGKRLPVSKSGSAILRKTLEP